MGWGLLYQRFLSSVVVLSFFYLASFGLSLRMWKFSMMGLDQVWGQHYCSNFWRISYISQGRNCSKVVSKLIMITDSEDPVLVQYLQDLHLKTSDPSDSLYGIKHAPNGTSGNWHLDTYLSAFRQAVRADLFPACYKPSLVQMTLCHLFEAKPSHCLN